MAESLAHMNLVNMLVTWIADSLLNGNYGHILIDTPEQSIQRKPPTVYDFTPDIFVINAPGFSFIIGEAKTATDLDNRHTVEQLRAFLRKCAESGTSLFVLAVPWHRVRLARSIVKHCQKMTNTEEVRTKVLEKLPG